MVVCPPEEEKEVLKLEDDGVIGRDLLFPHSEAGKYWHEFLQL